MTSRHPSLKRNRMQTMIHFLRNSNLEDIPKKSKVVQKLGASKRKRAHNFGVTIVVRGPRRIGSSPTY